MIGSALARQSRRNPGERILRGISCNECVAYILCQLELNLAAEIAECVDKGAATADLPARQSWGYPDD